MSSLERFIDGVMTQAIVNRQTVGATVAVVQNQRLLVGRGYGLADQEQRIAVTARDTQFRVGSVSKVLVWMAVMQLVEAGRVDLDVDVNGYLQGWQIPSTFGEPITLRHLMTHTPGFEDLVEGLIVSGPRQVGDLATVLQARIPRRVRAPGLLASYSNYGSALAAHVVESVSGLSWDDYVEQRLFAPLNIDSSTTRQPVPESIRSTVSKGYLAQGGSFIAKGFEYIPLAPAGATSATALDMAQLMVELLNPRGTGILSAQSKAQLLSGAYVTHPEVNGMTLGLIESGTGDTRAVGHGGATLLFHSQMVLWPDEQLGLFVSTNSSSGRAVVDGLINTLARHLGFDRRTVNLTDVSDGARYEGQYISARRAYTGFTRILGLGGTLDVEFDVQASTLRIGGKAYQRVVDDVFQQVDAPHRVVFTSTLGRVDGLYRSQQPYAGFTRAAPLQTVPVNLLLLGTWAVLAVLALVIWPVSSLTHRRREVVSGQRLAILLAWLANAILVVFFVQLALAGEDEYEFVVSGFAAVKTLLWWPVAAIVLLLPQTVNLYRAWVHGYWWWQRRWHYTLLYFAQLALAGWFWYWALLPAMLT